MALLDKKDVATLLSISVKTVDRMVAERQIPVVRIGSKIIRFHPQQVDRWIEKRTVTQK